MYFKIKERKCSKNIFKDANCRKGILIRISNNTFGSCT